MDNDQLLTYIGFGFTGISIATAFIVKCLHSRTIQRAEATTSVKFKSIDNNIEAVKNVLEKYLIQDNVVRNNEGEEVSSQIQQEIAEIKHIPMLTIMKAVDKEKLDTEIVGRVSNFLKISQVENIYKTQNTQQDEVNVFVP